MKPSFRFVTAVWNDKFVDSWLNTCLPFQINLLKDFSIDDIFSVYTLDSDHSWNKGSRLDKLTQVYSDSTPRLEFNKVSFVHQDVNYHASMANCHRQAMQDHAGPNNVIVFLSPDVIYSSNSFSYMKDKIEYGYKAVLTPMFRSTKELMEKILQDKIEAYNWWNTINVGLEIHPRDLLTLTMSRTHPMTDALFWDANPFCGGWPSHLYFKAPFGIIGQCWHQHPMAIRLEKAISTDGTIDADLLVKAGIHKEEIAIAVDSDDFCAVELTSEKSHIPAVGYRASIENIVAWAKRYATSMDHWYFQHRMRWHILDIENWDESEADDIVEQINSQLDCNDIKTPFDIHF